MTKSTTLRLDVAPNDLNGGMEPLSGTIVLTEAALQRIQELAALCEKHQLNEAKFFDFSMEWEDMDDTEMDQCSVSSDAVRWTAMVKHTDVAFETEDIRIADIEAAMR
ncbi:hypothetical protein [Thioalkalivibrio sp. ALE16]|uniref:hypothetical protein n=1 Tax=Thioalkalivibrio sp. ALE16 TaxID=1158172 RepID=UPI00037B47AA|nr:hypothetical protein [Thioalkalivibrio sp. ALE16]